MTALDHDDLSLVRRVAKPRDPILAKQIESILDRVDIYPPECDDLDAIDDAINDYLGKP